MRGEDADHYWPRQVGVAIALGFLAFLIALPASCAGWEQHLDGRQHLNALQRQTGRNDLPAFYRAVPTAFVIAALACGGVLLRASVRRRRERAEDAKT